MNVIPDLNDSVRDWYMRAYPSDDYGSAITEGITFKDLLENEGDTMRFLGRDTLIHERAMSELYYIEDVEEKVRDWYMRAFPSDELGEELNPEISFRDVINRMNNGEDIYDILEVGDSVVRERVFGELSNKFNIDYDVIYNKWLHGNEYPDLVPGHKPDKKEIVMAQLDEIDRCSNEHDRYNSFMKLFNAGVDSEVLADKEVALRWVTYRADNLQDVSDELRDDKDVVLAAVKEDSQALKYASDRIRDNKEVVFEAVCKYGYSLQYASEKLQNDKQLVMEAVSQFGGFLRYASPEMKADKEVAIQAVKQYWLALQWVSPGLRDDIDVVRTAVKQNPVAISFASERIRANRSLLEEKPSLDSVVKNAQDRASQNKAPEKESPTKDKSI